MNDKQCMTLALQLAQAAADAGEVPVGCVIVQDDVVVGKGRNRREETQNPLLHAEIEAIEQAARAVGFWRLCGCTLYVTLEPCPMCAGAIINSRIDTVVFGACDPKSGAAGGVFDLFAMPLNHRPAVRGGVLAAECGAILRDFFRNLRG